MKVSEKSLELNLAAEVLSALRGRPGMQRAYLRGLTQREERQEGADFCADLPSGARLLALQFKAPKGISEQLPYRYTLVRYQHEALFTLAQTSPGAVFYVFPFYVTISKLQNDLPTLAADTWLLELDSMPPAKCSGRTTRKWSGATAGKRWLTLSTVFGAFAT